MNRTRFFLPAIIIALVLLAAFLIAQKEQPAGNRFISYIADAKKQNVKFYWKDDKQVPFKSLQKLKIWLDNRHEQLIFAMNGGMYTPDHLPRGLFIDNTRTLAPLDRSAGTGNFYLKPNGVLYITDKNIAGICSTTRFHNDGSTKICDSIRTDDGN